MRRLSVRSRKLRNVGRDHAVLVSPVAREDGALAVRRRRAMRFGEISVGGSVGLHQPTSGPAAVNGDRGDLSPVRRETRTIAPLRERREHPSRVPEISGGNVARKARRSKDGYKAIMKSPLDDLPFLRFGLASPDEYLVPVGVDGKVTMSRPLVFGPGLQKPAVRREYAPT